MYLADQLTLDAPKRTQEGFLAVRARVARTGLYDYAGFEVDPQNKHGLRDKKVVKVYRPGDEVFDRASIHSFIGKPITDNHPREAVTSDNWRQHARGTIMGAVRDGEHISFDLLLTDKAAIAAIDAGKRELSNGYATELDFTPGTHDGIAYDAVQRTIRGNHVAIVDRGRAGPECAIKDGIVCDAITADQLTELQASFNLKGNAVKKIVLDGLQVDLSDADAVAAAFDKLQAKVTTAETALSDAQSAHDKEMAAKDAKIDELEAKVVDQAQIDRLADEKAAVVADAKKIAGDKLADTAGKTPAEVRRMAVAAKLGDAAVADKSDDYVEARFDGLKDAAPAKVLDSIKAPAMQMDGASLRDLALSTRNARFAAN